MISATGPSNARRGFTLFELCLVLALLSVAAALIAPALSRFLCGHTLNAEARRLLSLTRAAQSRASSEGVPVLLWFDAAQAAYGMERETTAGRTDTKAIRFEMGDRLRLTVVNPTRSLTQKNHLPSMRFLPDGSIDETSPATVRLNDTFGAALSLRQTRNRTGYEIDHAD